MGIIYKVTNEINDKVYIGQTIRDLEKRKKSHILQSQRGSSYYFHRALVKYGVSTFTWEVIEECDNSELNEKETFYIEKYGSFSGDGGGYNMTKGGSNCYGSSGETHWMKRLSDEEYEEWIKKHRLGKNNPNYNNGDVIRGDNHYTKWKSPTEVAEIIEKISGDNNYQKQLHPEERKNRHWIKRKSEDEIVEFKDKLKGDNNPYKKALKNDPEKYNKLAKERGKKYRGKSSKLANWYIITFPNGEEYKIYCFSDFCNYYKGKYNIRLNNLIRCVNGHIDNFRGFKLRKYNADIDFDIDEYIYNI